MVTVRYTALRSLYGVALGATVIYDLPVKYAGLTVSKKAFGTTRISMARLRERYHEATERVYSITTKPLDAEAAGRLRMFLDSCDREESFLFAPDATAFATAYLDDPNYDEQLHPDRDSLRTFMFAIAVP